MKYLCQNFPILLLTLIFQSCDGSQNNANAHMEADESIIQLSEKLLYAVKTEEITDSLEQKLANISFDTLAKALPNDNAKKTFWINIYNAYFQLLATRDKRIKPEIFTEKFVTIAQTPFSLDDIEHGILRHYRSKYSLGYLPQPFASKTIKRLAVKKIDYRIHFALNCGAKSCPPIAFYVYKNIDTQLDKAAVSFLEGETTFDDAKKSLTTSKILQWFKADFGGNKGIRKMIQKYVGKNVNGYKIQFNDYDWSAELKKF